MHIVRSAVLVTALAVPAAAATQYEQRAGSNASQGSVTTADIQRLQDQVYDASNEIARLRSQDQSTAERLQARLDDLRDDVIYLRVKMRREGSVSRTDYNDVRSQVDSLRTETRAAAQGQSGNTATNNNGGWSSSGSNGSNGGWSSSGNNGSGSNNGGWSTSGGTVNPNTQSPSTQYPSDNRNPSASAPTGTGGQTQSSRRNEVPAGTELDVRLEKPLTSDTAQVEDRFTATTLADLYQGSNVLIPAGSTLRGVVSSVTKATRTERKGALTVAFDQITVNGRTYPMHATVSQALESEGIKGEVGKIGAGAGVGAIIGGILGGAKGALLGVLIGGGGTIAATEGKDVTLPAGTVLRLRMEQPLQIR